MLLSSSLWAGEVTVEGLDGELLRNVNTYLNSRNTRIQAAADRAARILRNTTTEALQALGYYAPLIEIERNQDDWLIKVKPGNPVRIRRIDIQLSGDAQRDPAFTWLINNPPFHLGDPLHHGRYEQLKRRIVELAAQRGYLDGDFSERALRVDPEQLSAEIRLHYHSGLRYRFGEVRWHGSHIDQIQLDQLNPIFAGDWYNLDDLTELNRNLSSTGWFDAVLVTPDRTTATGQVVPVDVRLSPRLSNTLELSVGASDDNGARVKARWVKPWLNSRGDSFNTQFELSERAQQIDFGYNIPMQHALNDYLENLLGAQRFSNRDTYREQLSTSVNYHKRWGDWRRTTSLRWLWENYVQGNDKGKSNLIMPGISFTRTRGDTELVPDRADSFQIITEYASPIWGADIELLRVQGRLAYSQRFFNNHRLVARIDAGGLSTTHFSQVPSSLRFYAGGDRSVRGYGYESLAPRNEDGTIRGGRYLLTWSVGYQYQLIENWWGATFFDQGGAFDKFSQDEIYSSWGVGVRWASPIAVLRVDLAFPQDDPNDKYRIHFAIGTEL